MTFYYPSFPPSLNERDFLETAKLARKALHGALKYSFASFGLHYAFHMPFIRFSVFLLKNETINDSGINHNNYDRSKKILVISVGSSYG